MSARIEKFIAEYGQDLQALKDLLKHYQTNDHPETEEVISSLILLIDLIQVGINENYEDSIPFLEIEYALKNIQTLEYRKNINSYLSEAQFEKSLEFLKNLKSILADILMLICNTAGIESVSNIKKQADDFSEKMKSRAADVTNEFKEFHESLSKKIIQANLSLEEVESLKQRIGETLSEVKGDFIAIEYQSVSQKEESAANFWRWATIFIIVLTTIFAFIVFFVETIPYINDYFKKPNLKEVSGVLQSFVTISILLALSGYTGRQAGMHRKTSIYNKQFGLELKQLPGFLSYIQDENKRNDAFVELSKKMFGNHELNHTGFDNQNFINSAAESITSLIKKD